MNQSSKQLPEKANKKHRIYRRKNDQIPKEYVCTENCGKAYGSYAALYTHIKNKHGHIRPPQMKSNRPKVGRKGRPQTKQTEYIKHQSPDGQCRVCNQSPCQCVQRYDTQEKKKIIEIMADEDFINFTNQVGSLSKSPEKGFVRTTDDEFTTYSKQTVVTLVKEFNKRYNKNVILSNKLETFLTFTSKFWHPDKISELYDGILAIKAFNSLILAQNFIKNHEKEFPNLFNCIEDNNSEFQTFGAIVRNVYD